MPELGITPPRLVVLCIAILFARRIPALLMLYKWIPEIRDWREALFTGHFGPMGVGAIFVSTLALHKLPSPKYPPETQQDYLALMLQPIVTFVILGSIVIRASFPTIEVQVRAGNSSRDVASPVGPGRRELDDLRRSPPKSPIASAPSEKVVQFQVAGPEGLPTFVTIGEESGLGSGTSGSSVGASDVAGGNIDFGRGEATGARLPGGRSRIQRVANASSSSIVTVERVGGEVE